MSDSTATKVLVIDDDKVAQKFIGKSLSDGFDVRTASNGDDGIGQARDWNPQLILLDVEMPGKNGFEVCQILKSNEQTATIPVVFLSGRTGLEEKMRGYEVGGEDFLVKPMDAKELNAKVKRLTETENQKKVLSTEVESVRQTAINAITDSSELGKAIRFVEQTFSITSFDSLAECLFRFLEEIELKTCILFDLPNFTQCYSFARTNASPLEHELMTTLRSEKRFYDFGCRTQINYTNVALLIKNMPSEDKVRYGRIKDLLPFVLAAADEKVRILGNESHLRHKADKLSRNIDHVKIKLSTIADSILENQQSLSGTIKAMMEKLDENIPRMGLEDDQEAFIINTLDKAFVQTNSYIDENLGMRDSLDKVISVLNYLTEEQKQMLGVGDDQVVSHPEVINNRDDSGRDNVQLF